MTDIQNDDSLNQHESPSAYLKRLRKRNDYTQRQLGKLLDVNQVTVMRWEKGLTPISSKVAKQLALLFNVPVVGFFSGEKPTSKITNFDEIIHKFELYDEATGSFMKKSSLTDFVLPIQSEAIFCVKITTDAMTSSIAERSIPRGSVAFVAAVDSIERWENHVVYGTFDDEHFFIRELCSDKGKYFLRPWNVQYQPDYDLRNFKIMGCVLGVFVPLNNV